MFLQRRLVNVLISTHRNLVPCENEFEKPLNTPRLLDRAAIDSKRDSSETLVQMLRRRSKRLSFFLSFVPKFDIQTNLKMEQGQLVQFLL